MMKNNNSSFHELERIALQAQRHALQSAATQGSTGFDSRALSALISLFASQALTEKGVEHQLEGGSSLWRINSDEMGVISIAYSKSRPSALSAWICIGELLFDPSVGAVIDSSKQACQRSWRPDFIMTHKDDLSAAQDVYRYEAGAIHYSACLSATQALREAQAFMPKAFHSSEGLCDENERNAIAPLTASRFRRLLACFFPTEVHHGSAPLFV